jgi:hypothetical protein
MAHTEPFTLLGENDFFPENTENRRHFLKGMHNFFQSSLAFTDFYLTFSLFWYNITDIIEKVRIFVP